MATGAVRVSGLKELSRDFKRISKSLSKELTDELKLAAEPVKTLGQQLALGEIRNMTEHWSQMRIGVSKAQGLVYMVPLARRAGGSPRPNLKGLLLERAMDPALERNQAQVVERVDDMLGRLAGENGFH